MPSREELTGRNAARSERDALGAATGK